MNKKYALFAIAAVVAVAGILYFGTGLNQQASIAANTSGSPTTPIEDSTIPTPIMTAFEWAKLCRDKKPHIEILSPNGGETYFENDTITLKWRSCNLSSETSLEGYIEGYTEGKSVEYVDLKFVGSSNYDRTKNDGQQEFTIASWDLPVRSNGFKVVLKTVGITSSIVSDRSNNLFSILKPEAFSIRPITTSAVVITGSGTTDDTATFKYVFEATARNEDYFISNLCKQYISTTSGYITFDYESSTPVRIKTLGCSVTTSADVSNGGYFEIDEDNNERFTLTVIAQINMSAGNSALVRMNMKGIPFRKNNEIGLESFWTVLNPGKTAYITMVAR